MKVGVRDVSWCSSCTLHDAGFVYANFFCGGMFGHYPDLITSNIFFLADNIQNQFENDVYIIY